jgi:hypothetical protein
MKMLINSDTFKLSFKCINSTYNVIVVVMYSYFKENKAAVVG